MLKGIITPVTLKKNSKDTSNRSKQDENYQCFYHQNMTEELALTEMTFDDFSNLIKRAHLN